MPSRLAQRLIAITPAWAAIGLSWLVGHAIAAALGTGSEEPLWFLPWLAVVVLGAPAILRSKAVGGRHAVGFFVVWCTAVGVGWYAPPFEADRVLRMLMHLAVTVPAAYLLLDRPMDKRSAPPLATSR